MTRVDPDLVGIWLVPQSDRTYEVEADGSYHVADAESPVSYSAAGAVMHWQFEDFDRQAGTGETPVGKWLGRSTGEQWQFTDDGRYRVQIDGIADTGIWALRQGGAKLWTRELQAYLTTNGATVTFTFREGGSITYGYTVSAGTWTLHDASTWADVARFRRPSAMAPTNEGSPQRL